MRKQSGGISKAEKDALAAIVAAVPREINAKEEKALAQVMGRSVATIHKTLTEVRAKFAQNADKYVDLHLQATEAAIADGDYDTATKASQWMLTNVSKDGERVIDAPEANGPQSSKVVIGIQLGGLGNDVKPQIKQISGSLENLGD